MGQNEVFEMQRDAGKIALTWDEWTAIATESYGTAPLASEAFTVWGTHWKWGLGVLPQ